MAPTYNVSRGSGPRIRNMGSAGVVISNVESIRAVTTGTADNYPLVNVFNLFPTAFSWLGGLALAYSKYRWRRLRIYYLPCVSTMVSGRVAMSLKYDTADFTPTGAGAINAVVSANRSVFGPLYGGTGSLDSTKPFGQTGLMHVDVDCSNFDKSWYQVAPLGAIEIMGTIDRNMYIPASLWYGTDGATADITTGYLYAAYEVELIEPTPGGSNG